MSAIADIERLLERVFERTSARLFRTRLAADQLERRVERTMELGRTVSAGRVTVPNTLRVRLTAADLRTAAAEVGSAEALAGRLADAALAFARRNRYHLDRRPTVALVADPSLARGVVEVDVLTVPVAAPAEEVAGTGLEIATPEAVRAPATVGAVGPLGPPASLSAVAPSDAAEQRAPGGSIAPAASIRDPDPTRTVVFRRPAPASPGALLREVRRDGVERAVELAPGVTLVGRGSEAALRVDDARVSRRHGQFHVRQGALIYQDLGSTNGSRVNGIRVDEIALGFGDRLQVGDTVLVVERLPA